MLRKQVKRRSECGISCNLCTSYTWWEAVNPTHETWYLDTMKNTVQTQKPASTAQIHADMKSRRPRHV